MASQISHDFSGSSSSSSSFYDSDSEDSVAALHDNELESVYLVEVEQKESPTPRASDTTDHEAPDQLPQKVRSITSGLVQSEVSDTDLSDEDPEFEESVVPLPDNKLESVSSVEVEEKDALRALDSTTGHEATELPQKVVPASTMPKGFVRVYAIQDYPCRPRAIRDYPMGISRPRALDPTDHEATELPHNVVPASMPKGFVPYRRRRVVTIRDFPCPQRRFKTSFSEGLVQPEAPDSTLCDDSEDDDLIPFPENGLESIKLAEEVTPKALDDVELTDSEETSEYGAKELSEEAELELSSSIKSGEKATPKALDDVELTDWEGTSEYEARELSEEAELELSRSRDDSESHNSIISMYNISLNSFGFPDEEEEEEEEIVSKFMSPRSPQTREEEILEATSSDTKGLNNELSDAQSDLEESCNFQDSENLSSGQGNYQISEKGPSTGENQVPKQIVIALMATPNSPGSQKKRASTSNTTTATKKRRRKKHW
ncbi:hypothetical protein PTKIN_Ptkin04bG0203800 [Pterospermum kingtungense]